MYFFSLAYDEASPLQMTPQKSTVPNSTGSGWIGWARSDDPTEPFTYPVVTGIIIGAHWLVMTVWIQSQVNSYFISKYLVHFHKMLIFYF